MNTTLIQEAFVNEGALYEVWGEDGPQVCFSCTVGVRLLDGREFVHREFFAPGDGVNEEEGTRFTTRSRERAMRFADKVAAKGVIDLALWDEAELRESLDERFANYAFEENCERHGIRLL